MCCGSGLKEVLTVDTTLTDSCIEAMEAHADSLTRLHLHDVHGVSDLALIRLGSRCSRLRQIFMSVPSSAEAVVETFIKTAPQLLLGAVWPLDL
jgi:hypothetical protein